MVAEARGKALSRLTMGNYILHYWETAVNSVDSDILKVVAQVGTLPKFPPARRLSLAQRQALSFPKGAEDSMRNGKRDAAKLRTVSEKQHTASGPVKGDRAAVVSVANLPLTGTRCVLQDQADRRVEAD